MYTGSLVKPDPGASQRYNPPCDLLTVVTMGFRHGANQLASFVFDTYSFSMQLMYRLLHEDGSFNAPLCTSLAFTTSLANTCTSTRPMALLVYSGRRA